MKHYLYLAVCVVLVSLGACSNESKFPVASGKASVRAINTIPASPPFSFLIEERLAGSADYGVPTATSSFDDLEYTFNFDVLLAGGITATRVASQSVDVEADKDYTFIISGVIAAPAISVWESDVREWSGTETTFEVRFAHTAASLGDVDVYFAAPGIAPVLGSEIGTFSFGQVDPASDFEAGEFVMTITAAGDPTTVLFESDSFTLVAQSAYILSIFDGNANDLAPLSVRLIDTTTGNIGSVLDKNFPPTIRFFHASIDFGAADIYVDDPLTVPIVMNHVFRDVTGDIPFATGDLPLTYTTAGNMGSILVDEDGVVFPGTRTQFYIIEDVAGNDALIDYRPDRRSVETLVKMSLINTATIGTAVDIYMVPSATAIDDVAPLFGSIPVGLDPIEFTLLQVNFEDESITFDGNQFRDFAAGIDAWVTLPGEKTSLAGPVPLDVALGDVVEAIIYENVDPNVVDLVFTPVL